jgi:hypothetical protein
MAKPQHRVREHYHFLEEKIKRGVLQGPSSSKSVTRHYGNDLFVGEWSRQ